MLYLILSDLHLGKGKFLKSGQLNILEDFFEDEKFEEFLEFYSSKDFYDREINLILNGDILNLIQIETEGIFTHIVDGELTVEALEKIVYGHPRFFSAMEKFLKVPNKRITYIIGNHDAAMAFPEAQDFLKSRLGAGFEVVFDLDENGVYIEHGHRYEVINTVPDKYYYIDGPHHKKILNLPWGSLFCIHVLPRLRKERPFLDKVRPLNGYVRWLFFNDFFYFFKLVKTVLSYLWETNKDEYTKHNRNFKTTLKLLKQITIYPNYERKAKQILKKKRHIHTVVMGHTHVQEWRRFPEGKFYFNTGTWNQIPSIDAGLHEHNLHLTYCVLDVHKESQSLRQGGLYRWQGHWRPFLEEIQTN